MQAASVPLQPPDVVEAGRILANLDDLRAIMFMSAFVIIFLLVFTVWREWAMQSERKIMAGERKEMRELAGSFATSASVVATSLAGLSTKIAVLSALTARAEATIAEGSQRESSHEAG